MGGYGNSATADEACPICRTILSQIMPNSVKTAARLLCDELQRSELSHQGMLPGQRISQKSAVMPSGVSIVPKP